jgi:histidinol-phosphate aminotransferase
MSKSRSLAGLRVGFAMGHSALIEALERVKNSFNSYPLDRLAIAGAVAALEDVSYFEETRQKVMATRQSLSENLRQLGFEVLPSAGNFVFARHPDWDGGRLSGKLREKNIIVRHFQMDRIDQFLRITVGTDEDVAILCKALERLLTQSQR